MSASIDYANFAVFDTLRSVSDLLASELRPELQFSYCDFSGQVRTSKGRPLQDSDVLNATYELEKHYRWAKQPPSSRRVYEAIQVASRKKRVHPVRDYLQDLKWDGKERISKLFSHYLGACDSALRRAQSAAFMTGAVARIFAPGCKVDVMPVLISPQGWGKSTAIRLLAVSDEWFRDTPLDLRSKDCYEAIQGTWMVEIAEMRSIVSSSAETVKAFLTSQIDSYRPAYGRCNVYRPRQCVFIGSSNDLQLTDTTGNRRYWPIPLEGRPKWDEIEKDRDQLWAEAVCRFTSKGAWHLTDQTDIEAADSEARDYSTIDPWESEIESFWLSGWQEADGTGHPARTPFEASTLLGYLGIPRSKQRQGDVMRITRLMRGLGYTSERRRDQNKRRTYWTGHTGHTGHGVSKTLSVSGVSVQCGQASVASKEKE